MKACKLHSCLAAQIQALIDLRRLSGTDYQGQARLLEYFDRFLLEQGATKPRMTRQIIDSYQQSFAPRGSTFPARVRMPFATARPRECSGRVIR